MRLKCTDIEEVINILDDKFNKVSGYSLLLRGFKGDQSDGLVNMLMQIFDGNSTLLS